MIKDSIVPFSRRGRAPRVLIAVLIGLDEDLLDATVPSIGEVAVDPLDEIEPVCLTDCNRFALFRSQGTLFEYLPPPATRHRFAADLDWELYILRRLARLRRKWNPIRIVPFGTIAKECAQLWRNSPYEDEQIKELIQEVPPSSSTNG